MPPAFPRSPEPHIKSLDGLRGISALLVLFHHLLLTQPDFAAYEWHSTTIHPQNKFEWVWFETPLRVLWSGQERAILFFVLSGFVLSLPWLHGRPRRYGKFLLNRFLRLYPPYLIIMALAAAGAYGLGGHPLPDAGLWFNLLGWSQPLSWRALPSVLFLLNDPSSNWLNESVWSLVWEARVVMIFPLLIWPIMRWKNAGIAAVLAMLAMLHPALGLLLPHHLAAHFAALGTDLLYPEYFILGVAVALNRDVIRRTLARGQRFAGLTALLLGVAIFWVHWPAQNGRADGIAAALILAAALGSPGVARALETGVLLWLGRLSYSLYLIHVPMILTIMILFGGKVPLPFCAVMALICIGAAELFRRAVEAPAVRLTLAMSRQSPTKIARPGVHPYVKPAEIKHG